MPGEAGQSAARPGRRRRALRSAVRWAGTPLVAGAAVIAAAGLWLGGYPGSVVLPLATAAFAACMAFAATNSFCRMVSSAWLVAVLLLIAAALGAIGIHPRNEGDAGAMVALLWNTGPQVLCLIVVARLVAGLARAMPERES